MEFVQNFTPPDFQAKNFTLSISPNFNSFREKTHKKMSENGEIYTTGKKFTLPPAVTALTNSTSDYSTSPPLHSPLQKEFLRFGTDTSNIIYNNNTCNNNFQHNLQ